MATAGYKFPDEDGTDGPNKVTEGVEDKVEIDIIDDTPKADQGRTPLPKEVVEDLDKDDLDTYSEKVQVRMRTLKKAYHDERRAKESASRERDEAARFAQVKDQEVTQLKQRLSTGEKIYITETTSAAKAALENARVKLRQANASGDADLLAQAQEEMTEAKLKVRDVENFKPSSLQEEKPNVQSTSQVQAPSQARDSKAEAWRSNNDWFGADKKMTAFALGLHEELMESRIDPRSDDYYRKVDKEMRKRFPENFSEDDAPRQENSSSRKPATVVASASRSTGPRRVQLTTSQVRLAKTMGITNEAYAREMVRIEEERNGRE